MLYQEDEDEQTSPCTVISQINIPHGVKADFILACYITLGTVCPHLDVAASTKGLGGNYIISNSLNKTNFIAVFFHVY